MQSYSLRLPCTPAQPAPFFCCVHFTIITMLLLALCIASYSHVNTSARSNAAFVPNSTHACTVSQRKPTETLQTVYVIGTSSTWLLPKPACQKTQPFSPHITNLAHTRTHTSHATSTTTGKSHPGRLWASLHCNNSCCCSAPGSAHLPTATTTLEHLAPALLLPQYNCCCCHFEQDDDPTHPIQSWRCKAACCTRCHS